MDSRGEVIENSYMGAMQGRPAPIFSLNGVIKGWQEGVTEMQKGGRYRLYLPYNLAYGENGNQGIPPYETLTFEMEILNFGEAGSLQPANPSMGGM
jgi:FKBP-type peptidyl-prolyl cis-trans isomerase